MRKIIVAMLLLVSVGIAGCGGPSSAQVRSTAMALAGPMAHKTAIALVGPMARKTAVAIVGSTAVAMHAFETATASATFTLHGTLLADGCEGGNNIENASVEIRNEKNVLIGNATTSTNLVGPFTPEATPDIRKEIREADPETRKSLLSIYAYCKVKWVANVVHADRYQVKIGTHDGPAYTFAQLQGMRWHLDLNLASSS